MDMDGWRISQTTRMFSLTSVNVAFRGLNHADVIKEAGQVSRFA